jgi:2-succinyl-5-enolpyruvyl-6-hydroxy-3-cyclohexene-1-carboxylate synthase
VIEKIAMIHPKIPLAQTVIQLCKLKNIKHIIISPGSRNAPMTIGFTADDFFTCYSIVDERSAAFFALGIAQQIKHPVALVCTSGSALLNYYPAVSEAYYSDIPLVVLSADRPKHLIDIGDGQTINQKNVFTNQILYSANLKLDLKDEKNIPLTQDLPIMKNIEDKLERFLGFQKDIQTHNELEINTAINTAAIKNGPVHINVPFDEPLYETIDELIVEPKSIDVQSKQKSIDSYTLQQCFEYWNTASKKMILVGVNGPNEIEQKWLDELAEDDSVIVFTETTSNLHHDSFFPSIDQIIAPLTEQEQKELQPNILITFGGLIVSKKIKALLRKFQPEHHWHIDRKKANDTFFCLSMHIEATPNEFFEVFLPKTTHYIKSDYNNQWALIKQKRLDRHNLYLKKIPYSDFIAFNLTLNSILDNYILQVGNSSAIRYTQLFNLNKSLEVYCNRGTSGIDGSTSTSIGCAVISKKPTVFITGDLSFFYDSNALWNNYIPNNYRIIIVNNNGGGIFRILPGKKDTENFDTYFETKHDLNAKHLCNMFGFEYESAHTKGQIIKRLETFYSKSDKPKLLEVFTPRTLNDKILLDYFEFVKE